LFELQPTLKNNAPSL